MLAKERQRLVVGEVQRRGAARVGELTALLQVSGMTIRRDLDALQREGVLEKVHGGAVALSRSAEEPGFDAKFFRERSEKKAIAEAALALVKPHSSIALSAGTTTWFLASRLSEVEDLTVVTNSLKAADALAAERSRGMQLVLTGGTLTSSSALVGPMADVSIRSLAVDLLFLGVHGMDPDAGFTTPNLAEAETNRLLLAHAHQVVVLADHTKWRTIGLSRISDLSAADTVITDDGIDPEATATLQERVRRLIIARTADFPTEPRDPGSR